MNHFYDPVKDRGLTRDAAIDPLYALGDWAKSKDWAGDANNQNSAKYKVTATIASILDAIQQKKLSLISDETNFTWNEAIKYWLNGNKEKAMFTLGHTLHLIEDASVPDHTRNDPHLHGSPYEIFSGKYNLNSKDGDINSRLINKKPVVFDNLEAYFNEVAKYSNNNFYSKDTIGIQSGYELPEPDFKNVVLIDRTFYVEKKDFDGIKYHLIARTSLGSLIINFPGDLILDNELVFNSYWNLLSTKSVQYGAGVMDLFFKEVAKAENDPNFNKTQEKTFVQKAVGAIGSIFSKIGSTFSTVSQAVKGVFVNDRNSGGLEKVGEVDLGNANGTNETTNGTNFNKSNTSNRTNLSNAANPVMAEIVITEIMYSPTGADSGREWVEIFNNDDSKADLTGWKFFENGTNHNLKLVRGTNVLGAYGYAVITSDSAQFLKDYPQYQGTLFESSFSLNNSGEVIAIKAGDEKIDEVSYQTTWGANGNGKSLQLVIGPIGQIGPISPIGQNGEWREGEPTPGKATMINLPTPFLKGGEEDTRKATTTAEVNMTNKSEKTNASNKTSAPSCNFATANFGAAKRKVVINEVAWMGTSNSASDEWIELKNVSGQEIDINGWQVLDKGGDIKINLGELKNTKVKSGGYVLLERTDDNSAPGILADLIYSGTLNNSEEGLRLFDSQCGLVDEAMANPNWPAGENSLKKTMERDICSSVFSSSFSSCGWHTSSVNNGTPKKDNSYGYTAGGGSVSNSANNQTSPQPSPLKGEGAEVPQFYEVVINEIMYSPEGADEGREWIEIYNKSGSTIDLTDWKFNENDINHGLTLVQGTKNLAPGGYAVITTDKTKFLTAYPEFSANGNIFESSFSLNNTGEALILKNQDLKIDEVSYVADQGGDGNGKSLQLVIGPIGQIGQGGQIGEEWKESAPTPGSENVFVEGSLVNMAPGATFVFNPQNPIVGEEIIFDAASSTDSDGSTGLPLNGIALYEWNFGDGNLTTTTNATTTYTYANAGDFTVLLTVFDDKNASSTTTSIVSVGAVLGEATSSVEVNLNLPKIFISEIVYDGKGSDAGKEFVEFYSAQEEDVDLDGWTLKYKMGDATTTENLATFGSKDEDAKIISKNKFLLVGLNNYNASNYGGVEADIKRSASLPNGSGGEMISVYLHDKDGNEISSVSYDENLAADGISLERKALVNGTCVVAQGESEYQGNGCENNSENVFDKRENPNPQNSQSMSEPRLPPPSPENFSVNYVENPIPSGYAGDWKPLSLNLSWSAPEGFENLEYKIEDISDMGHRADIQTTSTSYTIQISEVGREYKFKIVAIDEFSLESDGVESEVDAPSFLGDVNFYSNAASSYALDLNWDNYPFISGTTDKWHVVIFYYNQEAPNTSDLKWNNEVGGYKMWGLNGPASALNLNYKNCVSQTTAGRALLLPDILSSCDANIYGRGTLPFKFVDLDGKNNISIGLAPNQFSVAPEAGEDYITAAFYSYLPIGTSNDYFMRLVGVDRTKYYFEGIR